MRNIICFIFGAICGISLPLAIAQTGMTIDQVEAQVVGLQTQAATFASQLDTLQTACLHTQQTLTNISSSNVNSTQAQVNSISAQLQNQALKLSTVGALTQLGLDNAAQLKSLAAQIAALTPVVASAKSKSSMPQLVQYQSEISKLRTDVNALKAAKK